MSDHIPEQVKQALIQHVGRSETALALIGKNDRFLYCNRAFVSMFGLEDFSLPGCTYDEFLIWIFKHRVIRTGEEGDSLEAWMEEACSLYRKRVYFTTEVGLKTGRWVLVAQQVYEDGHIVTVCTDITRSKEAELALHVAYAELENLARTDELTGMPNRRHFMGTLENECLRVVRHRRQSCLAMLDLDHFKQVNDHYGHPAGDKVLKHFSTLLRHLVRGMDVVGRLGGEEFAVLMPETDAAGAQIVLERVRQALAQAQLDFIVPGFGYTFSAGIAELPLSESVPPGRSSHASACIHEADQALYRAKAGGRNRTELAQHT